MVTSRGGAESAHAATDDQVAENVVVLLRRARITQGQLGAAVGISPQTMSRRLAGIQPWQWWEVVEIAQFFDVSLAEIAGELPGREEYRTRAVRHQGLEPRTRWLEGNPKSGPDLRLLRAVS